MGRQSDRTRIQHMLDHGLEALEMARGKTRGDLDADRQLNLSLVRLLEIIGEAANRVSPEVRKSHSKVPWQDIAALRNRLIHGYDEVDFDILWAIIQYDLLPLTHELQQILEMETFSHGDGV